MSVIKGVSIRQIQTDMERYLISGEGRAYYESGHVLGLKIGKPLITAKVQGRHVYEVNVNRRSFDLSWCSCPKDGYCKHMAAVVYAAVDQEEAASAEGGGGSDHSHLLLWLFGLDSENLQQVMRQMLEESSDARTTLIRIRNELKEVERLNSLNHLRQTKFREAVDVLDKEVQALLRICGASLHTLARKSSTIKDTEAFVWITEDEGEQKKSVADILEPLYRLADRLLEWTDLAEWDGMEASIAGLTILQLSVEEWKWHFEDEYGHNPVFAGCNGMENYLRIALERVSASGQYRELSEALIKEWISWLFRDSQRMEYAVCMTKNLGLVVKDEVTFQHLKKAILTIESGFPNEKKLQNQWRYWRFAVWWIELCLLFDKEAEARMMADTVDRSSSRKAPRSSFLEYYIRRERWLKAAELKENLLTGCVDSMREEDYAQIVHLWEKAGNESNRRRWLEQWLLHLPDKDTYSKAVEAWPEAEREKKTGEWIQAIQQKYGPSEFVIEILLEVKQVTAAWEQFMAVRETINLNEPLVHRLLQKMSICNPDQIVAFCERVVENIVGSRKRKLYPEAAHWLAVSRKVHVQSGQEESWNRYFRRLLREIDRIPTLKHELKAVGLMERHS